MIDEVIAKKHLGVVAEDDLVPRWGGEILFNPLDGLGEGLRIVGWRWGYDVDVVERKQILISFLKGRLWFVVRIFH